MDWSNPAYLVVGTVALLGAAAKLIYWMGKVEEHRGSVREFMDEIRGDIKKILERLPAVPIAAGSPVQLTDYGREIARKVRAKEWAVEVAPTLLPEVQGQKPFQVDQFSRTYVHADAFDKMDMKWRELVETCAYELGIDRTGVLDVLYVELRDELLRRLGLLFADPEALKKKLGETE